MSEELHFAETFLECPELQVLIDKFNELGKETSRLTMETLLFVAECVCDGTIGTTPRRNTISVS